MSERLNLRQLDYFVAAAELGTMSAAAERVHISQSAISIGIAELERRLGVRLMLRRKAKGLTLTEAGRRLLPRARALLASSEELQSGMRDMGQALAGRLMIGCFTTIAPLVLPPLLEGFQTAHPDVVVDFAEGSLGELQRLLFDGRCELALMYDVDIQGGIDRDVLYQARPYVLLPPEHPLSEADEIRLADLDDQPMVMLDVPPSMRYFSQVLAEGGVEPIIRHRTTSFETARSLVARGIGYSLFIQRPMVELSYEGRPLVTRPIKDPIDPLPVVLAWPSGAVPTRRATAFAEYCHAMLEDGGVNNPPG
jgi:DNA-binding transcriptional LysR family regulator